MSQHSCHNPPHTFLSVLAPTTSSTPLGRGSSHSADHIFSLNQTTPQTILLLMEMRRRGEGGEDVPPPINKPYLPLIFTSLREDRLFASCDGHPPSRRVTFHGFSTSVLGSSSSFFSPSYNCAYTLSLIPVGLGVRNGAPQHTFLRAMDRVSSHMWASNGIVISHSPLTSSERPCVQASRRCDTSETSAKPHCFDTHTRSPPETGTSQ